MAWHPLTITGLVFMIIFAILVIVGLVIHELNVRDRETDGWLVYGLMVGGAVGTVVGALLLITGLMMTKDSSESARRRRDFYFEEEYGDSDWNYSDRW